MKKFSTSIRLGLGHRLQRKCPWAALNETAKLNAAEHVRDVVFFHGVTAIARPAIADAGVRLAPGCERDPGSWNDRYFKQREGAKGTASSHMLLGWEEMLWRRTWAGSVGQRRVSSAWLAVLRPRRTSVGDRGSCAAAVVEKPHTLDRI
jgi:hypothetical protein